MPHDNRKNIDSWQQWKHFSAVQFSVTLAFSHCAETKAQRQQVSSSVLQV